MVLLKFRAEVRTTIEENFTALKSSIMGDDPYHTKILENIVVTSEVGEGRSLEPIDLV